MADGFHDEWPFEFLFQSCIDTVPPVTVPGAGECTCTVLPTEVDEVRYVETCRFCRLLVVAAAESFLL